MEHLMYTNRRALAFSEDDDVLERADLAEALEELRETVSQHSVAGIALQSPTAIVKAANAIITGMIQQPDDGNLAMSDKREGELIHGRGLTEITDANGRHEGWHSECSSIK